MHFGIFCLFWSNAPVYAEPSGDNSLVQKAKEETVLENIVQEDYLNTKVVELKEFENNTTEEHSLTHISDTLSFISTLGYSLWTIKHFKKQVYRYVVFDRQRVGFG